VVAVTRGRHPQKLDVTEYLHKNQRNLLAIRVKPYYAQNSMHHAPDDRHIGWFLGRSKLILTSKCMITNVKSHTAHLAGANADQANFISIDHINKYYLKGKLEVNYYPWFPTDGEAVASISQEVNIRP